MSEIGPIRPTYALAVPMQIGGMRVTTIALSLSEVSFHSPVSFAEGQPIEFSIVINASHGAVQIDCRGVVTRCEGAPSGRFESAATIDTLRIGTERCDARDAQATEQEKS